MATAPNKLVGCRLQLSAQGQAAVAAARLAPAQAKIIEKWLLGGPIYRHSIYFYYENMGCDVSGVKPLEEKSSAATRSDELRDEAPETTHQMKLHIK